MGKMENSDLFSTNTCTGTIKMSWINL